MMHSDASPRERRGNRWIIHLALAVAAALGWINRVDAQGAKGAGVSPGPAAIGPVGAVAIDPVTPTTLYAGNGCSGLFKSSDGGTTWRAINDGLPDTAYFMTLTIDPTNPDTLYAGTSPQALPTNVGGVFKSTDGGETWRGAYTGLITYSGVNALVVAPDNPNTLYVSLYDAGVYRSTDGGGSWRTVLAGMPASLSFAIDHDQPSTVYVGMLGGGVLFKTDNRGNTWRAARTGLPDNVWVRALAINPEMPDTLYAGAESGNVFASTDGAQTWRAASTGLTSGNDTTLCLAIDPKTPATLYAGTYTGVFKTTNGASTWRPAYAGMNDGVPPDYYPYKPTTYALAVDPETTRTLYAAAEGGLFKSTDGAATWRLTGLAGHPVCGDRIRTCSEQCDDGNTASGDGCDANCTPTACGNGVITAGEECDDGFNNGPANRCTNGCTICGNRIVTPPEQCDDGNNNSNDGCKLCTVCGNGVVSGVEECDDGNLVDEDGCQANCTITRCGNGSVDPGEPCDDGNRSNADACRNDCRLNVCGDGFVNPSAEQCDDGNRSNADACRNDCTRNVCGDGFLNAAAEECDDGNTIPFDGCTYGCTICGDGIRTPPEDCDDGNRVNGDGCESTCLAARCGDGVTTSPEECDDANTDPLDGCRSCSRCGNGTVTPPEECDDGNTDPFDGCTTACAVPGSVAAGPVTDVVVDPLVPSTLYVSTQCSGLFKSSDAGETWVAANTGLPAGYIPTLAADPGTPGTVYLARWEPSCGFPPCAPVVFKSIDGAATWTAASSGLLLNPVHALAVDPRSPGRIYAAGLGCTDRSCDVPVFRSTDAGATWRAASTGLIPNVVVALAIDPLTPTTLYAYDSGNGVFKSADAGVSWTQSNAGLSISNGTSLVIDPSAPRTLYAGGYGGIFKSTNASQTWNALNLGPFDNGIATLAIDPRTPATLYAGGSGGVLKSTDAGATWAQANAGLTDLYVPALGIDPMTPRTLYAATNSGLFKSNDGGASWHETGLGGVSACGDGIRGCNEECDDGNTASGDGCDANCSMTRCGNGIRTVGEQCDGGNGCRADCRFNVCGDSLVNVGAEQCDDGNTSNADECGNDCQRNVCRDGFVNPAREQCDDGNSISSDGCTNACTICGNRIVTPPEGCDDGNLTNGDGCEATCMAPRCGDGIVSAPEQCDDGNMNGFDGCTNDCTVCGNRMVTPPEGCDDGNADPSDGCTHACTTCGNGIVTPPEVCDDGNLSDGDNCDASCTMTGCGNAVLQGDEECDDGNDVGGDGCAANCTREIAQRIVLDPAASEIALQASFFRVPLPISGSFTVRRGRSRESAQSDRVPLAVRAEDVRFSPIPLAGLVCICIRGIGDLARTEGLSGSGSIGCDAGLAGIDVLRSIDHNTDDSDPSCRVGSLEDGSSAHPHSGVCNGPEMVTYSGTGPAGSAWVDLHLASWRILDGGTCAVDSNPDKGPDGVPCTDDDPGYAAASASSLKISLPRRQRSGFARTRQPRFSGGPSDIAPLPPEFTLRLTTGKAAAEILSVNADRGQRLDTGESNAVGLRVPPRCGASH